MKYFTLFWLLPLLCALGISSAGADDEPFPCPDFYQVNVRFWERIYSELPTSRGLIHDQNDLSLVYSLVDFDRHGPRPHHLVVRAEKERIRKILLHLASSWQSPAQLSAEEAKILALFRGKELPSSLLAAAENFRFQLGQKEKFQNGVAVYLAIKPRLDAIFAHHGLPIDLTYLPQVESSFNIFAYSKLGAAGMWQFTRGTGKLFLQMNYLIDERLDVEKSTHAAAMLLRKNYKVLGSWPLALTAYNHGLAGMARAKEKHGDFATIVQRYDSRSFGFASRNFYAEFLAARRVMGQYRQYFGEIAKAELPDLIDFTIDDFVDATALCRVFEIELKELHRYNPFLRSTILSSQKLLPKGLTIKLPRRPSFDYAARYKTLPPAGKEARQRPSAIHIVRKGDKLQAIAKRNKTTVALLKKINYLRSSKIHPGQRLRLPGAAAPLVAVVDSVVAKEIRRMNEGNPQPPLLAPASGEIVVNRQEVIERVRSGLPAAEPPLPSSMHSEASVAALEEQEEAEQEIAEFAPELPEKDDKAPDTAGPRNTAGSVPSTNQRVVHAVTKERALTWRIEQGEDRALNASKGQIKVEPEETLSHYAEWLEVQIPALRKLNKMRPKQPLHLGQVIALDLSKISYEDFQTRRNEYHQGLQADFFKSFKVVGTTKHRLKAGESLWKISHELYEIPSWLLLMYNPGLDIGKLRPGITLTIPEIEEITPKEGEL